MIEKGHMRINGRRVTRPATETKPGDVLTFPLGREIKIVEILGLPRRRGPAEIARSHYRELDREQEAP